MNGHQLLFAFSFSPLAEFCIASLKLTPYSNLWYINSWKLKSQGFSKSADPRLLAFLFSSPNCRQFHLGYFQIQYLMIVIFTSQTHNHCSPLLGGQMWKACQKSLGSPRCPRHLWRGLGVLASCQEGVHGLSPTIRPSVGSQSFSDTFCRTEDNDVALLRLKRSILMGPRVQVIQKLEKWVRTSLEKKSLHLLAL